MLLTTVAIRNAKPADKPFMDASVSLEGDGSVHQLAVQLEGRPGRGQHKFPSLWTDEKVDSRYSQSLNLGFRLCTDAAGVGQSIAH